VADHHADAAEVRGERAVGAEERRPQDTGRQLGVVRRGLVPRVDVVDLRLTRGAIDRPAGRGATFRVTLPTMASA
jgi:hypothetical protein